jgi:predicted dehydrogenase
MNEKKLNTQTNFSRRDFIKTSSVASAGILLTGNPFLKHENSNTKKRIAIVGVGVRSRMYERALLSVYKDFYELVGFCDVNVGRFKLAQNWAKRITDKIQPVYDAKDFDKLIKETKPDRVIVTTVDGFHHQYINRAMELGCDVITEKPMTIDAEKCQAIIDTQQKTGKKCTVTFNYRYSPPRTQVKDLLMSGIIGEVLSVDFHWMLNTFHGTDYFRRWHSQKKFSGGLMIHKATHHFDLVNWWLSAIPVFVYATGKREFYTSKMVKRFGLDSHHERCHNCP